VAGLAAKQGIIRNSANTVRHVKDVIGRPWSDLVKYAKESPVRVGCPAKVTHGLLHHP